MLIAAAVLQLIWTCNAALDVKGVREHHPVCYVSNELPSEALRQHGQQEPPVVLKKGPQPPELHSELH